MKEPSAQATTTTTFVVRFWSEWSGAEVRRRGRIEHVESRQRADFLGITGMLDFLERFGICAGATPEKNGVDRAVNTTCQKEIRMLPAEVKAMCHRINELYNQHDIEGLAAMHAPDFKLHMSALPNGVTDIQGWRMVWMGLWSAFPDLHNEVQDMILEGDRAVVRLVLTGTHQAEYQGIPATGKKISTLVIDVAQYEDGKVKAEWAEYNVLSMLQQLGVVPVPA